MVVADTKDPGTWVAAPGLVFMEKKTNATLPFRDSNGHAQQSSEQAPDIVGGIVAFSDAQKARAC